MSAQEPPTTAAQIHTETGRIRNGGGAGRDIAPSVAVRKTQPRDREEENAEGWARVAKVRRCA